MSSHIFATLETLEPRKLLAATPVGGSGVNYIGATEGLFAAANPSTTGITVVSKSGGGTSSADRDTSVTLELVLPNGGVKETTLLRNQLAIFEDATDDQALTGKVLTSGGGDTLTVKPTSILKANTLYRVEFNRRDDLNKIKDVNNNTFTPATYYFTTGTFYNQGVPEIKFSQQIVAQKGSDFATSAITIGPDNRLYVGTLDGYIYRYDIAADGTLANETQIDKVRERNGGDRFITGLTFDPRSTDPNNPVLWVSHGQAKFGDTPSSGPGQLNYADNYTGKISRLYGTNFNTYEDVIVNIPRSVKDHLNNQISFDPIQRNLYFLIPSHSAMGRADSTWGNRAEEFSTAAVFRLQLQTRGSKVGIEDWLAKSGAINLDPNSSRPYNFLKGTNPLRFYAYGIRNAYDMVWHSNGRLYMPTNSSAAGGNTPEDPDQTGTQQLGSVQQSIDDYLFDIVEGGYYGHPNPTREQYILNGGNPTSGNDPAQIGFYPVGTQPEPNYKGFAYNFGVHESPNGVIEYKSDRFGGALKGQLVVARYAGGSDLIFLKPNADGTFDQEDAATIGTTGLTGMTSVLDLVEDTRNGNIYTVTLDDRFGAGTVRLHKPLAGELGANRTRISMYASPGDLNGKTNSVTITNTGSYYVNIDVSATKITGRTPEDRGSFVVTDLPSTDIGLAPGQSRVFTVKYIRPAGDETLRYANLAIASDDPNGRYHTVIQLRGFIEGVPVNSFVPPPASSAAPATSVPTVSKSIFSDDSIEGSDLVLL